MILSRRVNDDDHRDGFTKWPFMTTHTWGEYPQGTWSLEVSTDQVQVGLSLQILFRYKSPKYLLQKLNLLPFRRSQNRFQNPVSTFILAYAKQCLR